MKRPSTITQAEEIISAIGSNLEVDAALIDRGILELAWAMRDIRPGGIETYTYPTTTSIIGGIYYEIPDEPAATETLQLFAALGASAGAPVPETVRLEIRNGNGEPGIAGRWAERMGAEGYVVETIGDAVTFDYATTQVVVPPGRGSIADLIIDSLGFGVAVPGPVSGGVDALVILGSDAS